MTSPSTDRRYGLNSSAAIKVPCVAATTANLTLSGEQTVDGVACVTDDRVLVKDQTDQTANGIYIVDTGSWTRDVDFDNNWDVLRGTILPVRPGGTTNGSTYWYLSTSGTITIGTSNLTFAQVNMLSYTEPAEQTVVSAATGADIWTAEGIVNWTGTATTTALGAATKVGSRRTLICAGACKFTADANLLIRGIASGTTVTMNANAFVFVTALATTQFLLEYSLSGSFTATGTGFSSDPTFTALYRVENGWVHLYIQPGALTGTSDDTAFTITGLPAEISPASTKVFATMEGKDNGSAVYVIPYYSGNTIILYNGHYSTAWTASGTKELRTSEITYTLN